MPQNPFGDVTGPRRSNPFGDEGGDMNAVERIEHAANKIRQLRTQIGAEGLSLNATRVLIEELSVALDSAARALRELEGK